MLERVRSWFGGSPRALPLIAAPKVQARPAVPAAMAPEPVAHTARESNLRRRIATVFDPSHPVETRRDLIGREVELEDLLSAALDLRQHVVLHGARGSGKTSLVRVFGDHADQRGTFVIYMACEPDSSFSEIMRPYLRHFPGAALSVRRDEFDRRVAALPREFGPRALLDLLLDISSRPIVLILDEFDRITSSAIKEEVASFMKLASDARSDIQLMLVGIAKSVMELIDGHPSLRRHMSAVPVGRISREGVTALIDYGERATGLQFSGEARALIARAACGSPYHIRLFCRHACIAAMATWDAVGRMVVDERSTLKGMTVALRHWSQTNERDARLFTRLAADPMLARPLEALARRAAVEDGLTLDEAVSDNIDHRVLDLLGDALSRDGQALDRLLFADTVAPQFLIVSIVLNEYDTGRYGAGQLNVRPVSVEGALK